MKFKVVKGSNCKNYVQVYDALPNEQPMYELVEQIVSRKEFKPFLKSHNKYVSQSYWINEHFFPATFIEDVETKFKEAGYNISVEGKESLLFPINEDDYNEYIKNLVLPEKYNIFDPKYIYQPQSAFFAIREKIARVEIATGGGKTMLTYLYCRTLLDVVLPTLENKDAYQILIVVPRKDLCKQLKENFAEYDSLQERKIIVETIFSGSKRIIDADVVVGTYQSLSEYEPDYFNTFFAFVCDEVHTGKSYSIRVNIFSKMKNVEFALGMTGTFPKYNTLDYLNLVAMFGRRVMLKKASELIEDCVIAPVKIHNIHINYSGEDANFSQNLIKEGIIGTEKYHAEKEWFHNNLKRTLIIVKLLKAFSGNSLILVDTVDYCDLLKEIISENCPDKFVTIIYGETDDDTRDSIRHGMENRDDVVLIATYGTMSTGISINNIMNLYFPDGGKSDIRIKQSLGRGMRLHPNKKYLDVFDFQDCIKGCSFWNQALERNKIYKAEGHEYKTTIITI